jgi:type I restriction enzyme R subunit
MHRLIRSDTHISSRSQTMTEADTCRRFVVPALQKAGWDDDPHVIAEQRTITDGRIVPVGKGFVRKPPKRADYLLYFEGVWPSPY